jgi:hypothetical protein
LVWNLKKGPIRYKNLDTYLLIRYKNLDTYLFSS